VALTPDRCTQTGPEDCEWTERPDDFQSEAYYREALLELEAEGTVQVLSKDGKSPSDVDDRPKRKGKPTLAGDYFVTLRN
jgi:hypothetical protein